MVFSSLLRMREEGIVEDDGVEDEGVGGMGEVVVGGGSGARAGGSLVLVLFAVED